MGTPFELWGRAHQAAWLGLAAHVVLASVASAHSAVEDTVKIQYALPLAVIIGVGFGALATRGLGARTTTPPIYVVVEIDEITDPSGFEAFRQTADAALVEVQFEDGRYLARTENVTALDGSAPKFFAFIGFDTITKAKSFNDSMKNITALRTKATKSRSFIVEGTMR